MKCPHVSSIDCPHDDVWACAMCKLVDIKRNKPSILKMRKADSFIIHKYKCPMCDQIHHCENQSPKYLEVWKEKCPTTDIDVDVKNKHFVEDLKLKPLINHGK